MPIEVYPISSRQPRFAGSLANSNDFVYNENVLPAAILSPEEFLSNPTFSLYCFDDSCAIFVELPPKLDLTQVPFVHQAQYENARRVVRVPLTIFNRLAAKLPPVVQPILLYMSARSGSTLLSHMLNASGAVTSLSEADAFTQFVHLRVKAIQSEVAPFQERDLSLLADSTMRFMFRPKSRNADGKDSLARAVKFRSEGVHVIDLFQQTFPQSKSIFLYRDALGWVNSFHRIFNKLNDNKPKTVDAWQTMYEGFLHTDLSHLRSYVPQHQTLSLAEQLTLWWVAIMEWYLEQWEMGTSILAVRYNDLNQQRVLTTEAIFSYCDLPLEAVPLALTAFDEDSQAGTELARDVPHMGAKMVLGEQAIREIVAILQHHPVLRHPNFWAPGTLDLNLYVNTRRTIRAVEELQQQHMINFSE